MAAEEEKSIEQIQNLKPYLSVKTQEELDAILAYWEEMKAEWERKKQKFWKNHDREDFKKLLRYKRSNKKEIEWYYKYLNIIKWLERGRFIEEYLYDDILYSWELDEMKLEEKKYSYDDWKEWNVVMEEWVNLCFNGKNLWFQWVKAIAEKIKLLEWVYLDLSWNKIWAEWVKVIVQNMKLKRWVALCLGHNGIWDEWAKIVAENMNFEEWVILNLYYNEIWDEWAMAISKMKLKEWVELYLNNNEIWDKWAETIMKNMELKEWVILQLSNNKIWEDMKQKLREWGEFYRGKWIDCKIRV